MRFGESWGKKFVGDGPQTQTCLLIGWIWLKIDVGTAKVGWLLKRYIAYPPVVEKVSKRVEMLFLYLTYQVVGGAQDWGNALIFLSQVSLMEKRPRGKLETWVRFPYLANVFILR